MERHAPDWISGIFGVALSAVGATLLATNLRWETVEAAAIWAFGVIALGVLLIGSALVGASRGGGE